MRRKMYEDKRATNSIIAVMLLMGITASAVAGYFVFYKDFTKESQKDANMNMPQITIYGPTSGNQGDTISLWVKNSGNTDFSSWAFTQGVTGGGGALKIGDQIAVEAELEDTGPWSFKVKATTVAGKQIEDALAVQQA